MNIYISHILPPGNPLKLYGVLKFKKIKIFQLANDMISIRQLAEYFKGTKIAYLEVADIIYQLYSNHKTHQ